MSTTPSNEDQKVAEWAESCGYKRLKYDRHAERGWRKLADDGKEYQFLTHDQATFFYKAQETNTKCLLDKVGEDIKSKRINVNFSTDMGNSYGFEAVSLPEIQAVLDQIRKEEL